MCAVIRFGKAATLPSIESEAGRLKDARRSALTLKKKSGAKMGAE
jgi:hypothetical protein